MPASDAPRQNAAQLKGDIDAGKTGDKIGGVDPAAAPMGADAEAGGAGPTSDEVAQARAEEGRGRDSGRRNAAEPKLAPDARGAPGIGVMPVVLGAGAGVLLGLALLVLL